jgi:hypothetical protein
VQDLSALVYAEPKAERPSDDLWRSWMQKRVAQKKVHRVEQEEL